MTKWTGCTSETMQQKYSKDVQNSFNNNLFFGQDTIFTKIMACTKARSFETNYRKSSKEVQKHKKMQMLNLRIKIERSKMKENKSVNMLTSHLLKVVNQLWRWERSSKEEKKKKKVEKILISFSKQFEVKIFSLE